MQTQFDAESIALTEDRGGTYVLFARLLRQEISPVLLSQLREMRIESHDIANAGEGQRLLDRYLSSTDPKEDAQVLADIAADYAGLFLNAGDHPVHPYESVYTNPNQLMMQDEMEKVRQRYAAAGLNLSCECHEPEDHIALEMEFMNHLCLRTVAAVEDGNVATVRTQLQFQREFLEKHLLIWVPLFCQDLIRNATTDFYRGLGYLIRDFLELERNLNTE